MPIPESIKKIYYYLFDKYARFHVESFFSDLFDWIMPGIAVKCEFHMYVNFYVEHDILRHACHNYMITAFNYPWSLTYTAFIYYLFMHKDDYLRCYYCYIGRYYFQYVNECTIADVWPLNEINMIWYEEQKVFQQREIKFRNSFKRNMLRYKKKKKKIKKKIMKLIKDYYIFNYCLFILKMFDVSLNLKPFKKIYKLIQSMYVSAFYFFNTLQCMPFKDKCNIKVFYKERFKFIIFINKFFLLLKYIHIFTEYEYIIFLEFLEFLLDFLKFSDINKDLRIFSLLKLSECLKKNNEWLFFKRFIFNNKILIELNKFTGTTQ